MEIAEQIERLKNKLLQPLPGIGAQEKMAARVFPMPIEIPVDAKTSAVLCLLFPMNDELYVLLMKRMADNTAHSGQVSFPGGRYEPTDANIKATALREANEEVGIAIADIEILGALTPLYIPVSKFNVHPFVGYTKNRPTYQLSKDEVAYILELPLSQLFHESGKTKADVSSPVVPDVIRQVPAYVLEDGTIIWGATAMILSELEVLLENS